MQLSPFERDRDLDDVIALQHRVSPPERHWTRAEAGLLLLDPGHAGGANLVVARAGDQVIGVVGWVDLGGGELYATPIVSIDQRGVVDALLAHVVALGQRRDVVWIRASGWPYEHTKADALNAAGFLPAFEFVEFERPIRDDEPAPNLPADSRALGVADIDFDRYAALYNACFEHVDNAPAITADHARAEWTADTVWSAGSRVWVDSAGAYRAFCLCHDDGIVELVGVDAAWRRRGVATALLGHIARQARAAGIDQLRSICATTNPASLRLHAATGFHETGRRTVWQLDL